jgi:sialate O-acetylesterase
MQKILITGLLLLTGIVPFAQLKLPSIFADQMVLQYGRETNVWGWAAPGSKVDITFMHRSYSAITNPQGEWKIKLAPARAGASGAMLISSGKEKVVISHILAGEVWVCSGQSNMEFTMSSFKDVYQREIASSKDDHIRFLVVKKTVDNKEKRDALLSSSWTMIDSTTIGDCSATAYFFARKLREKLKVPVGLIISSWGGTPAQAWMDAQALQEFPEYSQLYEQELKLLDFSTLEATRIKNEKTYLRRKADAVQFFKGMTTLNYPDTAWEKSNLPGNWEDKGYPEMDGLVAYRIAFNISNGEEKQPARLHLPAIDDIDSTYINGVFTGSHYVWNEVRNYQIPPGTLKAGKNIITIWVEDTGGGGGLNADTAGFYVEIAGRKITLSGEARMQVLLRKEQLVKGVNFASLQNQPAVLFNTMIAPLLPATIRGVIWYQGESNADKYTEYRTLFPRLISNWRNRWAQPELPFLFVQLASFNPAVKEPLESKWAGLREAQTYALQLPKTGMAVTIDVGDRLDIHPKRKKEVGERLAANAFHIVYGMKNETPAGPLYKSHTSSGNTIVINYDYAAKGLWQKGEKLEGFVIAGADKQFVPANASIQGNTVVVSAAGISSPVYVRYAWADAPLEANLYNKEGLPAAPFRTDK